MEKKNFSANLTAAAAYLIWGTLPLYWMLLDSVNPFVVVSFRILFSILCLSFVLFDPLMRGDLKSIFMSKALLLKFIASSLLIFINWAMFIWGINHGLNLDISFGYFMTPLFQVILGVLFLKEKMDAGAVISFILAFAAIVYLMVAQGFFPWFSLMVSFSFALYGLVKKKIPVNAYSGLFAESVFMLPLAVVMLIVFSQEGVGFGRDWLTTLLLVGSGVATTLPMLLYNLAAKKITLVSLGFYQYLSPTLMFLIGLLVSREPIASYRFISFGLIWAALIIYTTVTVVKSIKSARLNGKNPDEAAESLPE